MQEKGAREKGAQGKGDRSRTRILEAASRLIYVQGFWRASFADIAQEIGIAKGNLYYHFKTKDELLLAIIDQRLEFFQGELEAWEEECSGPRERLKRFLRMVLGNEKELVRFGCPIGSLTTELGKDPDAPLREMRALFDLFLKWLEREFRTLGVCDPGGNSRHLLAMAEGAALLAHAYGDGKILRRELEFMEGWLDSL